MSSLYWYLPCADFLSLPIPLIHLCPYYTNVLPTLMSSLYWCPSNAAVLLILMPFMYWCPPYTDVLPLLMSSLAYFWNFPETFTIPNSDSPVFYRCLILPVTKHTNLHFASHQDPQSVRTHNSQFSNPLCLAVQQAQVTQSIRVFNFTFPLNVLGALETPLINTFSFNVLWTEVWTLAQTLVGDIMCVVCLRPIKVAHC